MRMKGEDWTIVRINFLALYRLCKEPLVEAVANSVVSSNVSNPSVT
jgi:hypothetical protein